MRWALRTLGGALAWLAAPLLLVGACGTTYGAEDAGAPAPDASAEAEPQPEIDSGTIVPVGVDAGDEAAAPLPASCTALHARSPELPAGTYTIDPGKGVAPFAVYCNEMTGAGAKPKEYLNLAHSLDTGEPTSNFTRYPTGGACSCPDFVRYFTKVRLRISDLTILTDDFTFTSPSRAITCDGSVGNCHGPVMRFGQVGSCIDDGNASGTGNVDLRGTGFTIDPLATFVKGGNTPSGTATISTARDFVVLTGGGFCGWIHTASDPLLSVVRAP